jgi:hypothetical protein
MTAPLITIFVRHGSTDGKPCRCAGDEFSKRCDCRRHLRWSATGEQHRRKPGHAVGPKRSKSSATWRTNSPGGSPSRGRTRETSKEALKSLSRTRSSKGSQPAWSRSTPCNPAASVSFAKPPASSLSRESPANLLRAFVRRGKRCTLRELPSQNNRRSCGAFCGTAMTPDGPSVFPPYPNSNLMTLRHSR